MKDNFELDLGLDGVREAIRLITVAIEHRLDSLDLLTDARRVLVDAKNALEAVECPDSAFDDPEIVNGIEI